MYHGAIQKWFSNVESKKKRIMQGDNAIEMYSRGPLTGFQGAWHCIEIPDIQTLHACPWWGFDWHDGHRGLLFWDGGWGMCVCVYLLGGWDGGLPLWLPPLEIQKAICLALGFGTGGRYDVGLATLGQEGSYDGMGGLFQIFGNRHTHIFLASHKTILGVSLAGTQSEKPPIPSFLNIPETCNPSICWSLLFRSAWCLLEYGCAWQGDGMTAAYQCHKTQPPFDKTPQWYYTGA